MDRQIFEFQTYTKMLNAANSRIGELERQYTETRNALLALEWDAEKIEQVIDVMKTVGGASGYNAKLAEIEGLKRTLARYQ